MSEYSWMNHSAIADIEPAKLAILISFAESAKGKKAEKILPLLMQANTQIKEQNLTFTKEEQDLLLEVLTEDMSDEDKKKVALIKQFAAKRT